MAGCCGNKGGSTTKPSGGTKGGIRKSNMAKTQTVNRGLNAKMKSGTVPVTNASGGRSMKPMHMGPMSKPSVPGRRMH